MNKSLNRSLAAWLTSGLAFAYAGCGEKTGAVTTPGGKGAEANPQQQQPAGGLNGGNGGPGAVNPNDVLKDNRLLDVVMRIRAKTLFLTPCTGDLGLRLRLQVNPEDKSFRMIEIPKDTIKCMIIGNIGIKQMLEGGGQANVPPPPDIKNNITERDNVINFKFFLNALYEGDGRPFLPAFISTPPDELKKINVSRSVSLTDWVTKKKASGTITARTLRYQPDVAHGPMSRHFKEVYDFEFKNDGFDGVNRIPIFLFDRMEMRISLKPFAILGMKLDTTINRLMASMGDGQGGSGSGSGGSGPLGGLLGGGSGGASGGLIGGIANTLGDLIQVHIEGELIEAANLPKDGKDDDDDGVVTSKDGKGE